MVSPSAPGYPSSVTNINGLITAYNGTSPNMTAGHVLSLDNLVDNYKLIPLLLIFNGAGSAIAVNSTLYTSCGSNGNIVGYQLSSPDSGGSATVKFWKKASTGVGYSNNPTSADLISTAGVSINTASGTKFYSNIVTDFTTTAVTALDDFAFNITACSVLTKLNVILYVSRT